MTRSYVAPWERSRRVSPLARRVPWLFGLAAIGAEIAYPLTDGTTRDRVTIAAVVLFFLAGFTHAWGHRGLGWALGLTVIAGGGGLLVEALGVATGVPFGDYAYADRLGPQLLDVPAIIGLAWAMLAYPALLVGRKLSGRRQNWLVATALAAVAFASWDLFLDPQMVDAGQWTWSDPTPALPGVTGVPLTNFAGWLLVSLVLMAVLHTVLPERPANDALPATLYLWTYASSVVANLVFFDRPGVALAGGAVMGAVALPYAWSLWADRP
jgi:putative membrane protein